MSQRASVAAHEPCEPAGCARVDREKPVARESAEAFSDFAKNDAQIEESKQVLHWLADGRSPWVI
jgi:hypothetical protein